MRCADSMSRCFIVTSEHVSASALQSALANSSPAAQITPIEKQHEGSQEMQQLVHSLERAAIPRQGRMDGRSDRSKRQIVLAPTDRTFAIDCFGDDDTDAVAAAAETAEGHLNVDGTVQRGVLFAEAPQLPPSLVEAAAATLGCLYDLAPLRPGLRVVADGIANDAECTACARALRAALTDENVPRLGARYSAALTPALIGPDGGAAVLTREDYALLASLRERCRRVTAAAFGEAELFHCGALITRISADGAGTAEAHSRGAAASYGAAASDAQLPYWHAHVDKCSILSYDISAVLYLSAPEPSSGGGLAFLDADGADRVVETAAGRLVAFTSGVENVHQVRRVEHGERLAMPMFFTLSREHKQPEHEPELQSNLTY